MSSYDSTGISMDRYATILADMVTLCQAWKGQAIDTTEQYLLGHLLRQMAYQADQSNQKIQAVYDALSIGNATGTQLDNMAEIIGLERQSAAKSTATLTCTVSKACTIPAGSTVRTSTNIRFTTDSALVFTTAGSDDVDATCTKYGPHNADVDEINTIVTAINGWTSVINASAAIPGRYRETDAELKLRHSTAVSTSGDRDAASISEAVGAVDGVSAVLVTEDYTSSTPIYTYVIGGDDGEIASAIDGQRTAGIATGGTTSVGVYDSTTKQTETIRFTRATDVDIYIDMTLTVNNALFPSTGEADIKAAIEALFDGQNIGEDVIYFELPGAIYQIPGVVINSLTMGTSPSPTGTSDISVSNTNRAVIDAVNIGITLL
jgi:uncharacterized phage protein gp47/JayE